MVIAPWLASICRLNWELRLPSSTWVRRENALTTGEFSFLPVTTMSGSFQTSLALILCSTMARSTSCCLRSCVGSPLERTPFELRHRHRS
jgi:hypothetical protein